MKQLYFALAVVVSALFMLGPIGCSNTAPETTRSSPEHGHPSEGPHGGELIEFGNEEYHAELVHDKEAGNVTIYLLDAAAKTAVPIDASEVTINLKHDGRGVQFNLAAAPDADDPQGLSSRFMSSDQELADGLDRHGADPQLVVTVQGKQYRGQIEHEHGSENEHHEH